MDLGLAGKKALIGGASKGLGLACAQALAAEGCGVALASRSLAHLQHAAETLPNDADILLLEVDLATKSGVADCLAQANRWGPVHVLVNNTGGPPLGGSDTHTEQVWQAAYESLLLYVKRMCDGVIPGMQQLGWGRIITITSRTVKEPAGNLVLSNVFRTAVTSYLKVLSTEVAPHNITVNSVLPGAFRTDRYEHIIEQLAADSGRSKEQVVESILAQLPQGRFQRPEELGNVVAYLASEAAGGITGASIPIDGGMLKGLLG